jgi:chemotaxis response regulator CheB
MREYGRTPPPGGGLALLGSLPRKEDYGSQKSGEARKEYSAAGEEFTRGDASAEAWPEGRTGDHPQPVEPSIPEKPHPIVGVGASAGGFEAFRELLKALPSDTGLALVLVQHLDPGHESLLAKLLSKATAMPSRRWKRA